MNTTRSLASLLLSASVLAGCVERTGASVPPSDCDSSSDAACAAVLEGVGMNDVSVLYPLPADRAELDAMLAPATSGARGELLPRALGDLLPELREGQRARDWDSLRVVSVRLDPCFPSPETAGCTPQVRLVLQPIDAAPDGRFVGADAALHVFYALDREALLALIETLVEARGELDLALPLVEHPRLAVEGLEGAFATALRDALLSQIGEENLTRVTFFALRDGGRAWDLGGFDRVDGALVAMAIPGVEGAVQRIVALPPAAPPPARPDFRIAVDPAPEVELVDDVSPLFEPAELVTLSPEVQASAIEAALRVESPLSHDPTTIDCASCHVATSARRTAEARIGVLESDARYTSELDLTSPDTVPAGALGRAFHAFGYLGPDVAVSQRTVNETAATVTYLRALALSE